jgi:hypothetical protein
VSAPKSPAAKEAARAKEDKRVATLLYRELARYLSTQGWVAFIIWEHPRVVKVGSSDDRLFEFVVKFTGANLNDGEPAALRAPTWEAPRWEEALDELDEEEGSTRT